MKKLHHKARSKWRKLSRGARYTILGLIVLLIAIRLALPYAVKAYVNRQIDKMPEYSGEIGDVDLHLYRGAYRIQDIRIMKTSGKVPVPFFLASQIDISIEWKELFHGAIVGEIRLEKPVLNFVAGPTKEQSQTAADKDWRKTLDSLFPFRINRFEIEDGVVTFRNFHSDPKVDISVYELSCVATNLTNSRDLTNDLPAFVRAKGRTIGEGGFQIQLGINPLARTPTFDVAAGVSNLNLIALNDFFHAYGKFDVNDGTLDLYTEIAAADGRYEGYVKPLFEDLDVYDWDQERKKSILKQFWNAVVGAITTVFENQPKNRLATKIPISGDFGKTDVDIFTTIGNLLRNAFIKAFRPRLDRTVSFEEVKQHSEGPPNGEKSSQR